MFDIDKKRVYQICDEIDQRGLDFIWGFTGGRVNHCDEELYRRVHKSGCKFIGFGIESGNQKILDFMRKRIKLEQVRQAVTTAKQTGLRTMGYFMLGMLGEDESTIRDTVRFAKSLDLDAAGFSRAVPIPGTELYNLAKQEGFVADNNYVSEDLFGGDVSLIHTMDANQLDKLAKQAYWEFFWTRSSRRLPRHICNLLATLSPVASMMMGGRIDLFLRLNRIRESLHLPLP